MPLQWKSIVQLAKGGVAQGSPEEKLMDALRLTAAAFASSSVSATVTINAVSTPQVHFVTV
jgi:hypothetical protein